MRTLPLSMGAGLLASFMLLTPLASADALTDLADLKFIISTAASQIGSPTNSSRNWGGLGFLWPGSSGRMGTADLVANISTTILRANYNLGSDVGDWITIQPDGNSGSTEVINLNQTGGMDGPYIDYVNSVPSLSAALVALGRSWHLEMNSPVYDAIGTMQQTMMQFSSALLEQGLLHTFTSTLRTNRASGTLEDAKTAWSRILNLPGPAGPSPSPSTPPPASSSTSAATVPTIAPAPPALPAVPSVAPSVPSLPPAPDVPGAPPAAPSAPSVAPPAPPSAVPSPSPPTSPPGLPVPEPTIPLPVTPSAPSTLLRRFSTSRAGLARRSDASPVIDGAILKPHVDAVYRGQEKQQEPEPATPVSQPDVPDAAPSAVVPSDVVPAPSDPSDVGAPTAEPQTLIVEVTYEEAPGSSPSNPSAPADAPSPSAPDAPQFSLDVAPFTAPEVAAPLEGFAYPGSNTGSKAADRTNHARGEDLSDPGPGIAPYGQLPRPAPPKLTIVCEAAGANSVAHDEHISHPEVVQPLPSGCRWATLQVSDHAVQERSNNAVQTPTEHQPAGPDWAMKCEGFVARDKTNSHPELVASLPPGCHWVPKLDPEWRIDCDPMMSRDEQGEHPDEPIPKTCHWVRQTRKRTVSATAPTAVAAEKQGSVDASAKEPKKVKGKLYTHKQLWGERRMRRGEMGMTGVGVVG